MKTLPQNLKKYKSTPVFTEKNVPSGLLKNHMTRPDIWGVIQVQKGQIKYTIQNKDAYILSPDTNGIVEPETPHHIKPLGSVSFFITFYKQD